MDRAAGEDQANKAMDIKEQLAYLRQTVAQTIAETNLKYQTPKSTSLVEDLTSGEVPVT